jgi:nucleoside-diphosphate-sugar epimerase
MRQAVFVTGGTGYLGRALLPRLVEHGHAVTALARPGSQEKLAPGVRVLLGDALARGDWMHEVPRGCTFVHLVGTPRPAPWKAREFEAIDLASVDVAIEAASAAHIAHFVYLSVARPAPVMRAYQAVRAEAERRVERAFDSTTFVRPWYVLGPGHRWPSALLPLYAALAWLPATRAAAQRLGLVTLEEMTEALVGEVERPSRGRWVLDVARIRSARART